MKSSPVSTDAGAGTDRIADAVPRNWVEARVPASWRPYLQLSRLDRPIGIWLLLWPGLWSLTLAASAEGALLPNLWLVLAFAIGAVAMRGAGCTLNDLIDRDLDAKVARTANRPLPSGRVSPRQALVWLGAQAAVGLVILMTFNWFAVALGLASVLLIVAYPFMKRITFWPQVWLGLTFNWGALLGWAAATGGLGAPAIWLYLGAIFWTVGYDTIYAHQDKEDDALIGVKSSALALGGATKRWLRVFYSFAMVGFLGAILAAGGGLFSYIGLLAVGIHFLWQIRWVDIDVPHTCLMVFKSNQFVGALLLAGLVLGLWL